MIRLAMVTLAAAIAAAGCARDPAEGIRYIGLSDVEANELSDQDNASADATPDAVRHVQSNKVLGAMAFQKVTGRAVDPGRLAGD